LHIGSVLYAMGYRVPKARGLKETIKPVRCDVVLIATGLTEDESSLLHNQSIGSP
jgi:hypothetical protein